MRRCVTDSAFHQSGYVNPPHAQRQGFIYVIKEPLRQSEHQKQPAPTFTAVCFPPRSLKHVRVFVPFRYRTPQWDQLLT